MTPVSSDSGFDPIDRLGVYQVYTGSGTGSGFLLDARHLLTNAHVVAPYREVAVEMRDRSRLLGRVRRVDPHRDLAIVELDRAVDGEVLPLGDGGEPKPKQTVHILGFPVGLPLSLTEGVISHARQLLDDQYFLQTDAAINPGNSGGPMLDDAKRVIGVTTCKLESADAVGFGIPVADVRPFVEAFRAQPVTFGVDCPTCTALIVAAQRYCSDCGTDLGHQHDIVDYFEPPDPQPIAAFVEGALKGAGIDPVLARHGEQYWSFHTGSAPIKVWCCCSEHLNFSSPLARTGEQGLEKLFRFLLSDKHAPCFFDLQDSTIRFNLVVHVADVFTPGGHAELRRRVRDFVRKADRYDNVLIKDYGCVPAPETQTDVLAGHV